MGTCTPPWEGLMGIKIAPSFDNLILSIFETNALSNTPFHAHTWWRYLDDIFMILTEGLEENFRRLS